MREIKPIETIYKGYRFRSRLEARWAVFFDALGVEWQYEKEGYHLKDGVLYLPDFWLETWDQWAEIKPAYPSRSEIEKCRALSVLTGKCCLLIWGEPWAGKLTTMPPDPYIDYWDYWDYRYRFAMTTPNGQDSFEEGESCIFTQCRRCSAINFLSVRAYGQHVAMPDDGKIIKPIADSATLGFGSLEPCCDTDAMPVVSLDYLPRLVTTYTAARQARFEHGEKS